ncbi:MAG: DUF58 domain-containing protein [Actinomycetota bacterium]
MTRAVAPKLVRYLVLAAGLVFTGLLTGRVEFVAVSSPVVVAALAGLAASRPPSLEGAVVVAADRCLEGDVVAITISITSASALSDVEVAVQVPDSFQNVDGSMRQVVSLEPGTAKTVTFPLRAVHWGSHLLGLAAVRVMGPGRFAVWEGLFDGRVPVKVFPRLERIERGLPPPETQVYSGNYVARSAGDGIEFSNVRPFEPGDRVRSVNWRVTTRRDRLHVNVFHPERNADVVVFLDTFGDYGSEQLGSLEVAVRGASGVVRHYLERKDRVGLVAFGGVLRWITVSMAHTQVYRIVDALLESQAHFSFAWKDVDLLPHGTLPPSALIVAFTPLVDRRATDAIRDLFARGFPVVVVDTMPEERVEAGDTPEERLAHRVWKLQRAALRSEFGSMGIPVLRWWETGALDAVFREISSFPWARAGGP